MHEEEYYEYAGFGQRFIAAIIDGLIVGVAGCILCGVVAGIFVGSVGFDTILGNGQVQEETIIFGIILYLLFFIVMIVGGWLYYALQESSPRMATIGKRAMGLVVTDLEGHQISFARASGRFFGKWISGSIMYVGYIMAAFTEKKQALHDMIANSLVMQDS